MENDQDGGWVTLAEAAAQVGVSADGLRRRIKRGRLPARKVSTSFGETWLVPLAMVSSPTVRPPRPESAASGEGRPDGTVSGVAGGGSPDISAAPAMVAMVGLVRELRDELRQKDERLLAVSEAAAAGKPGPNCWWASLTRHSEHSRRRRNFVGWLGSLLLRLKLVLSLPRATGAPLVGYGVMLAYSPGAPGVRGLLMRVRLAAPAAAGGSLNPYDRWRRVRLRGQE